MSDDQLLRAFDAPCRRLGLELDDVELRPGVIQVTVDRSGGGPDLDVLAELSKALSALLDGDESLAPNGRYELEVSSPGLERRLRRPEQFRRAVDTRVSVRTRPGVAGERRVEGVLREADADRVVIGLDSGAERSIAYDEIERGRTVFDWQGDLAARRAAERAAKGGAAWGADGDPPPSGLGPRGVPPQGENAEDGHSAADGQQHRPGARRERGQQGKGGYERERVGR